MVHTVHKPMPPTLGVLAFRQQILRLIIAQVHGCAFKVSLKSVPLYLAWYVHCLLRLNLHKTTSSESHVVSMCQIDPTGSTTASSKLVCVGDKLGDFKPIPFSFLCSQNLYFTKL